MFRQLAIIIGCLAVGEFIVWLTGITIPSSILGMLLLTFLLKVKVIKLEWVETISNFLVKNMGYRLAWHSCSTLTSSRQKSALSSLPPP